MIDLIGWIGNIFFLSAAILISRKIKYGFLFNIVGNSAYIFFGILAMKWSITILSIMLVLANIYGFINWSRK